MHELLLVFCHVRQLADIAALRLRTGRRATPPCPRNIASAHCSGGHGPSRGIAPIVILFACTQVAQTQTRLGPWRVFARPVDILQYHGYRRADTAHASGNARGVSFWAGTVLPPALCVAHAPIVDGLELTEVTH